MPHKTTENQRSKMVKAYTENKSVRQPLAIEHQPRSVEVSLGENRRGGYQ